MSHRLPDPPPFHGPRVILEDEAGPKERLDIRLDPVAADALVLAAEERSVEPTGWSSATLVATGIASLVVGLSALETANFVATQFLRSPWLGGLTLGVAGLGYGLILWAAWRELRGLLAIRAVDRAREAFRTDNTALARREALEWAESLSRRVPAARDVLPALRDAPDIATIRALLEAGPLHELDLAARAMGRTASVQAFAATAIAPTPAWDALVFGWRGVRLVRQVAALHGLRPGIVGTLALLRRAAFGAAAVAATDVLADAATRAVVSNPLLEKIVGEAASGAVAARRMLTLSRATAEACRIVPRA